ncbi:MAG: LysM peptidoglycan-binding domain-containing protein [Oscillospiraceae bacterium]|nr:LysM peptidoglycan-binding domain-containing protein [Oscillospiraceae bacterium]
MNSFTNIPCEGIDLSKYNGTVDFSAVKKAGKEFAILRAGYARVVDPLFEANYSGAKAAGLAVGIYWYSYAANPDAVRLEADCCLRILKGKQFEMPIYFDYEYEPAILALSNAQRTQNVKIFLDKLESTGYYAGLYASSDFINNLLNYKELAKYDIWAAQYASKCTCKLPFGMWQHHGGGVKGWPDGSCAGVKGAVDLNTSYKNYLKIIINAGLNGFAKTETPAENETDEAPVQEEIPAQETFPKTYTVQAGDSFWKIAAEQLGNGNRYKELAEFNGLSPESVIFPGQMLKIPIRGENR